MHVALIDDSIDFDGYSPSHRPLGGPEKAFASLPGALAQRGHTITVINRCKNHVTAEGAAWMPWDAPRPPRADVLIAFRDPALLGLIEADRRILWLAAPAGTLAEGARRKHLERHRPTLVFMGAVHRATWPGTPALPATVIEPGVRDAFRADAEASSGGPPTAIITTHPLHGLTGMLDAWEDDIHPLFPDARLKVYSNALHRGWLGGTVPDGIRPVLDKAVAMRVRGVEIERPKADFEMAEAYRAARVHLYPGIVTEMYCATLAESQACGLPAVANPGGAVAERIREGRTGYVVPDAEAFAKVALQLLKDDVTYNAMSASAKAEQRARGWDAAAAEFEKLMQ